MNNNPKIILFLFILLFSEFTSKAGVITVCKKGCIYSEINNAVVSANAYDTLVIKGGTYYVENIKINKPLVILGETNAEIDGNGKYQVFIVESDSVTIKGLKFCNTGRSGLEDMAGIKLENVKYATITGNMFDNCYFGVYLAKTDKSVITNNIFIGDKNDLTETGNGIHCWKANDVLIENNYVSGHRDGIYFEFVTNSTILENRSYKNTRYGLHFMFSDGNVYRKNVFASNGAGVAVMYSEKIHMEQNRFSDNWGSSAYGLLLKDINDCKIVSNVFENNTAGAYIEGSNRVSFDKNIFTRNGWAVRLLANCASDSFTGNTFTGNTFDFSTNGTMNNNFLNKNYWDKYEGYDLDRNKIGDVPYRPVSAYSVVIENVPMAMIFMRSFMVEMMDRTEKVLPSLIPENLMDEQPLMQQPL